jgi:hypothetical protein
MAGMFRNGAPIYAGMSGRKWPESVAGTERNTRLFMDRGIELVVLNRVTHLLISALFRQTSSVNNRSVTDQRFRQPSRNRQPLLRVIANELAVSFVGEFQQKGFQA